ncbi:hypothetical protein [Algoriphagus persicinus]|uniref:hypothetical protein n=1 Tax=Algoriphagus persicinus TaxID=3108754 RepID=UPI002B3CE6FF|nr:MULTISPECIES: hypothetical protein [unclassified Algoriphagus]MEB2781125.1 hypothetical protein [Algoriphagus sp. C2-6-M1]MEB2786497.1 hypothetical protein [Algoriphagus sp. E1-3-M2]
MKTLIILAVTLGMCFIININNQTSIIGTWVSTDDTSWKRIFKTDGKCYEYYGGQLQDTYVYSIKTGGVLCSKSIIQKPNISYLELINVSNSQDKYCYEIASLSQNYLQLIYFQNGKSQRFKRQ